MVNGNVTLTTGPEAPYWCHEWGKCLTQECRVGPATLPRELTEAELRYVVSHDTVRLVLKGNIIAFMCDPECSSSVNDRLLEILNGRKVELGDVPNY